MTISEYDMMFSSPFHKKIHERKPTHGMVLLRRDDTFKCAICGNVLSIQGNFLNIPTIFTYCPLWNHNDDKILYDYPRIRQHFKKLNDAFMSYYKKNISDTLMHASRDVNGSIIDIIYSYC